MVNAYTIVFLRLTFPLAFLTVQLQSSSHYVVGGFLSGAVELTTVVLAVRNTWRELT